MHGLHEQHHSHVHHALCSDLTKIFFFRTISSFANSMIFIFIPIFLYQQGFSIIPILLYAMLAYTTVLVFDPFAISIISKIGFRYSLLLSIPFSFVNFFFVSIASQGSIYVALAAVSQGLHLSLFFTSLNAEICTKGHKHSRGNDVGNLNIMMTLAATCSPFIGSLILFLFSFNTLLVVVILISIISAIPLLLSKEVKLNKYHFSYKDYVRIAKKKDKPTKLFFLSAGADIILLYYVWPVALFILLDNNVLNMGGLLTAASIVSVIVLALVKKQLDKKPKQEFLKVSSKIIMLEYILKCLSYFFLVCIYIVEVISKINGKLFAISYTSIYYSNAAKSNYMDYILLCDLYGRLGRILCAIVLIALFWIFGTTTQVLFSVLLFGIVFAIGMHYLQDKTITKSH